MPITSKHVIRMSWPPFLTSIWPTSVPELNLPILRYRCKLRQKTKAMIKQILNTIVERMFIYVNFDLKINQMFARI